MALLITYTVVSAAILSMLIGPLVLPLLRYWRLGQFIREDGPGRHRAKAGTPTMGGVIFLASFTAAILFWLGWRPEVVAVLVITLGYGLVGFIDDYLKVVKRQSLGLKARYKLAGQLLLALLLALIAVNWLERGTVVSVPLTSWRWDLGAYYYLVVVLLALATTNSVNLTDGLDGLAAGSTVVVAGALAVIAWLQQMPTMVIISAALAGSLLGFLCYNYYPARVFMGDTGSLALGGALATLVVIMAQEMVLPLLGGLFVAETISVIVQVFTYRLWHRRLFRMSPIHHHFELSGWSELRVVWTFWLVAALCAGLAIAVTIMG